MIDLSRHQGHHHGLRRADATETGSYELTQLGTEILRRAGIRNHPPKAPQSRESAAKLAAYKKARRALDEITYWDQQAQEDYRWGEKAERFPRLEPKRGHGGKCSSMDGDREDTQQQSMLEAYDNEMSTLQLLREGVEDYE